MPSSPSTGKACASSQALLDRIQLATMTEGGVPTMKADMPEYEGSWLGNTYAWLDLEVRVPKTVAVALTDSSGDVEAEGLAALDAHDSSGDLKIRDTAGEVSHYGRLDDLVGLRPESPLELRPFVAASLRHHDPESTSLARGYEALGSVGLDLKWHISQELTLDATFFPDFGQVEADQVVLNLTTFEQYYPEKRPFFLEGIELFATPGQLSHADPSVSPSGLAWSGFGTDLQLSTSSRMPSSSASLSGMVLQFGSAVPSLPSATAVLHFAWFGFEQQL